MNVARDGVHSLAHELAAVLDCDGSRHPKSNHALALNFFIASARASSRSLDCALMAKLRPQSGTRCCPPESQTFRAGLVCLRSRAWVPLRSRRGTHFGLPAFEP